MRGFIWFISLLFTFYHGAMLLGCLFLGKMLLFSKFGAMRLLMQPQATMKAAGRSFKTIMHHLGYAIIGALVIAYLMR